jgi:hypothetical protein
MSFFTNFRKRVPTPEQLVKLAKITDPHQRRTLMLCIENGEAIPDFAWRPIPPLPPEALEGIRKATVDLMNDLQPIAHEKGLSPLELLRNQYSAEAKFDALVAKARKSGTDETGWLCTQIRDISRELEFAAESRTIPLFAWGNYFLTGVTFNNLALAGKPGASESLLIFTHMNLRSPGADVVGIIPDSVKDDKTKFLTVLLKLAKENRSTEQPVMAGLPTYVMLLPGSPLQAVDLKDILFEFTRTVELLEPISGTIARYQTCYGEPKKRAEKELEDLVLRVKNRTSEGTQERFEPMSRGVFEEWWKCVADPEHVKREMAEITAVLQA